MLRAIIALCSQVREHATILGCRPAHPFASAWKYGGASRIEPTTSSLRTMRSPKKPQFGVHLEPITVQNGPIQIGSPGVASQLSSLMRSDWIKVFGIDLFPTGADNPICSVVSVERTPALPPGARGA